MSRQGEIAVGEAWVPAEDYISPERRAAYALAQRVLDEAPAEFARQRAEGVEAIDGVDWKRDPREAFTEWYHSVNDGQGRWEDDE